MNWKSMGPVGEHEKKTIPYTAAENQPISTEIRMADGVFMKTMVIPDKGTVVPQHSHTYPHVSVLVRGSVRVRRGDARETDYRAPAGIVIPAGVKHLFTSLEDNTIVLCVHDIGTAEGVSVQAEHHIVGHHP